MNVSGGGGNSACMFTFDPDPKGHMILDNNNPLFPV